MFPPANYASIPNVDLLSWTFDNPSYDEGKDIYIDAHDESRRINARQAKSYVRKLIKGLHVHGLKSGDTVCVHAFNNILYSTAFLGIVGAGGCYVGSNPGYTTLELNHLLTLSSAKFILVEPDLLQSILPAARECSLSLSNIFMFDIRDEAIPRGFESWNVLLQHGEGDWLRFDDEYTAKSTKASILSTSGTTGLPKAALMSHFSHVAQSVLLNDSDRKPYEVSRLMCLPQFHAFAAPLVHVAPLREGHTTYIMKRFDLNKYIDYTRQYRITETAMVPPIVISLLGSPLIRHGHLSSLRYIWCAGAPLDASIQRQLIDALNPSAKVSQVWGMSEIGWITSFLYPEGDDTGSVGRLLPNMEAKIVDAYGDEIFTNGQRGEILVRGPSVMLGYLGNTKATKGAYANGWLKTGDIGYCNDGKWYIVDRVKEIIKVRGWQVAPTELEACLLTHPCIVDAAVIGVKASDQLGEQPRAYVVVDPSVAAAPLTDIEVKEYLGERLSRYKALAGGVVFVTAIPKSPSGKILKKILREMAQREKDGETNTAGRHCECDKYHAPVSA